MDRGYIKLWRKISEWAWYRDSNTLHVFLHFLLNANHKDFNFMGYEIKRGDIVIGRKKLSEDTGISERSLRTALDRLKTTKEVTIKTTSKFSIITLCNYEFYQSKEISNDQQNDQQNDQHSTSIRPQSKNERIKEVNIYTQIFENFWKEYPRKKDKGHAFKEWIKQIKTTEPEIIIAGAKRYALECKEKNTEEKYIKMSQGWLSGQRWLDEKCDIIPIQKQWKIQ